MQVLGPIMSGVGEWKSIHLPLNSAPRDLITGGERVIGPLPYLCAAIPGVRVVSTMQNVWTRVGLV